MKVIEPIGISIIVKRKPVKKVTESGILLPDSHTDTKRALAEVVSFGNGVCPDGKKIDMPYKIGDTVIMGPYVGVPMECDGYTAEDELRLITHNDVYAFERDSEVDVLDPTRITVPGRVDVSA